MEQRLTLQHLHQHRAHDKLRRELGPEMCSWLEDPDVIEALATGSGDVWLDRLSVGKARTGLVLPEAQRRLISGTVAGWDGLVVNQDHPLAQGRIATRWRPVSRYGPARLRPGIRDSPSLQPHHSARSVCGRGQHDRDAGAD